MFYGKRINGDRCRFGDFKTRETSNGLLVDTSLEKLDLRAFAADRAGSVGEPGEDHPGKNQPGC